MGSFESEPGLGSGLYLYVCKPGGVGCRGPQAGGEGNLTEGKKEIGQGVGCRGAAGRAAKETNSHF